MRCNTRVIKFSKHMLLSIIVVCVFACILSIGGCSKSGEPTKEGGNDQNNNATAWSMKSSCVTCHKTEGKSGQDPNTTYAVHYTALKLDCTTCHKDDDGKLSKAHEDIAGKQPSTELKRTEVAVNVCSDCHSKDEMVSATESLEVFRDFNGIVINPHDLPTNDSHAKMNCGSCHVMHDGSKNAAEIAAEACKQCHHAGFEPCKNCHDE